MKTSNHIVIADIYDPMHLEQLEQGRDLGDDQRAQVVDAVTAVLSTQLRRGDFFLCASQRQHHFWLSGKPPQRTGPGLRDTLGFGPGER